MKEAKALAKLFVSPTLRYAERNGMRADVVGGTAFNHPLCILNVFFFFV